MRGRWASTRGGGQVCPVYTIAKGREKEERRPLERIEASEGSLTER